MDRRTQGRHVPQRSSYLGIIVHIHDVDWSVGVTHKKYGIFVRLEDIQQVYVSSTVYEDKIMELERGERRGVVK